MFSIGEALVELPDLDLDEGVNVRIEEESFGRSEDEMTV